jgi:asparagine synthase (glutamine-hydrolysing)
MCGLFAAIGKDLPESRLKDVFSVLDHRGPDGRGVFADEAAKLTIAHTRLAVIDPKTGAQPLVSDDGNIVLAVNGEIYDFERIRSSLEAQGCHFRTGSDSEVIIHLYRQFGLGCFDQLRGEFAFLLYDRARRSLIAARDRFGIKPLYLSRQPGGRYVFASEMKAIFASGLVVPKLNAAGFDPLLDQDPEKPRLPFEDIEHVPPATYMMIDLETGKATSARYWSGELPSGIAEPIREPADKSACESASSVLECLEEAVRLRLRADVPVGLYLSGGVDSTVVAALMKRNLNSRPHSFSISFEGSERSEGEVARRAADYVGTEHHDLIVTKKMLWDNLERALWFSELPFVTLAPVGKFLLSEEARKFVTVVLTGEGADEVFLGYRSFFQKAIRETRNGGSSKNASLQSRRLKLGKLSSGLSLKIFHKSKHARLRSERTVEALDRPVSRPLVNRVQEERLAAMPFDILCYLGDREEMAHSLEARLPFLDHHLYDLASLIPVDLKIRGGVEKAVLRDCVKGILPDDLRLRRKSGFMLTSEAVDLFGADKEAKRDLRRYLSRQAFEHAGIFSYRAYLAASFIARLPARTKRLKRLRRNSNKLIMYMMQAHMLDDMFVVDPPWAKSNGAVPTATLASDTSQPSV